MRPSRLPWISTHIVFQVSRKPPQSSLTRLWTLLGYSLQKGQQHILVSKMLAKPNREGPRLSPGALIRACILVPRIGFEPMISTLKGWRPNRARRPGLESMLLQSRQGRQLRGVSNNRISPAALLRDRAPSPVGRSLPECQTSGSCFAWPARRRPSSSYRCN